MSVSRESTPLYSVIIIDGFFSIEDHENFEREMRNVFNEDKHVIVDLTKTKFIDSSSLGLLIRLDDKATTGKKKCVIVNSKEEIYQVFDITGLTNKLKIVKTLESAIEFIKSK